MQQVHETITVHYRKNNSQQCNGHYQIQYMLHFLSPGCMHMQVIIAIKRAGSMFSRAVFVSWNSLSYTYCLILNSVNSQMDGLYLQKRLYRTDNSRLIISQPSPLFKGLFAFHIARRYLISNIENTTNLKNAAVAKALKSDSVES
jgi:hypothetical protein